MMTEGFYQHSMWYGIIPMLRDRYNWLISHHSFISIIWEKTHGYNIVILSLNVIQTDSFSKLKYDLLNVMNYIQSSIGTLFIKTNDNQLNDLKNILLLFQRELHELRTYIIQTCAIEIWNNMNKEIERRHCFA